MADQPKWTPGPWQVANTGHAGKKAETFRIWRNDPNQPRGDDFRNAGYFCVAPHVRGEANAHLIAAAPDLYAALNYAMNFIANTESEMGETLPCGDAARAALSKANP